MDKLNEVGGITYTPEERPSREGRDALAHGRIGSQATVQAFDFERPGLGSTDVGDVSWTVPTVGLRTATRVPGTPAHSWQATAAGGMSIGYKGMNLASQTLALMGRELFTHPKLIAEARAEFEKRRGPDFSTAPCSATANRPSTTVAACRAAGQ
jgi:aminobenzoyl-glutamate utilization protein B